MGEQGGFIPATPPRRTARVRVAHPAIWEEIRTLLPLDPAVVAEHGPREREVDAAIEGPLRQALERSGRTLLRREPEPPLPTRVSPGPAVRAALEALSPAARSLLHRVQRRATEGFVSGAAAWDPHAEARPIAELVAAGLMAPLTAEADPLGPWQLREALPPPPEVVYDFAESFMDPPEDLPALAEPIVPPDEDLGVVAAALRRHPLRVTHALTPEVSGTKALGRRLADPALARTGRLDDGDARWRRALDALRILGALRVDELSRELRLTERLLELFALRPAERADRLLRRALDPAILPLLAPIRAALRQADTLAVDTVVFLDLLHQQHRDVLFSPWGQVGIRTYPRIADDPIVVYNEDNFEDLEGVALQRLLHGLARMGMIRTAPGVFAATRAGRAWAGCPAGPRPPIHVTPDLEILVPPGALEAGGRYRLELLAHPTRRDVVDSLRLRRPDLELWLTQYSLDEALALLDERSAHGLPLAVREALTAWAEAAERVVWLPA